MEMFTHWEFWLFTLNLIILAFNYFSHQKIVYNDLKHLSEDVKQIQNKQEEQTQKINHVDNEIAYLKGIKEKEDRILKVLEKSLNK